MLEYAVLAVLRTGPAYGYGLRAELNLRGVRTWKITAGHIYHLLHDLESKRFVRRVSHIQSTSETPKARKTPEAHFYEITPDGAAHLDRWLSRTPRPQRAIRREIVVRLMPFDDGRLGEAIFQLERELQACRKRFAKLKREFDRAVHAGEFSGNLAMICEEAELCQARAHIEWVESALRRLRASASSVTNGAKSNPNVPEIELLGTALSEAASLGTALPESASTEGASTEGASTEGASTEGASTEGASTESASTESASTESASTENASPKNGASADAHLRAVLTGRA